MTAGLVVAAARGSGVEDTLRLAAAVGTLNATRHGLGTGRREDIERVARHVSLQPIGESRPDGARERTGPRESEGAC